MNRFPAVLVLVSVLSSVCGSAFAQLASPRQVAAAPDDILAGIVRLPDPAASATSSRTQLEPLRFALDGGTQWTASASVAVDAAGAFTLALLGSTPNSTRVSVRDERGAWTPIERAWEATRAEQLLAEGLPGWFLARYDAPSLSVGRHEVRIDVARPLDTTPPPETWLCTRSASTLALSAWVGTQELVADGPIPILARLERDGSVVRLPAARMERARVIVERLDVRDGARELALFDDGAHADGAANDGTYGALLPAGLSGSLRARVELAGSLRDVAPFARTVPLAFSVLERRVLFDGGVEARESDELHVALAVRALPLGPSARLHVSTEVWGSDASGALVPVCWLSRMLTPRSVDGAWALDLELDRRWIELANARAPFELRELRVQDPDTQVVFDRLARVAFALPELAPRAGAGATAIVPEMLTGGASTLLQPPPSSPTSAGPHRPVDPFAIVPALMLVHGYCSSGTIWPAADFTSPKLEFLDPNANRTHDQFAQLLAQRAQQNNLTSFGVVAHSQGGCAALHLLTYYASALDAAVGPHRIQSVATPYQGTPLASLGGFTCGVNNDMTPAGSATWLAGIPTWARNEVWYWTTSNTGSACNFLTNLFLTDPEDGTVEQMRGQLPGAHNQGHTTGWCHTTGMSNPANYTDHARNQAMNAAAAR